MTVSAIVTAYRRIPSTLETLRRIRACDPPPDELLVHVDGNEINCAEAIKSEFPDIKVILSQDTVGPGGGRNKLIAASTSEIVAAFDDDSYPLHSDYFARAGEILSRHPAAAVLAAEIQHRGEICLGPSDYEAVATSFVGCGAVYRRSFFQQVGGYVPVPLAYGVEEEDIALRFQDLGYSIVRSPQLRVYHDTFLEHHLRPDINAAAISNIALLAWLRYPTWHWGYAALQVANRVVWCLREKRYRGIATGLFQIPPELWRYRHWRAPVRSETVASRRKARENEASLVTMTMTANDA